MQDSSPQPLLARFETLLDKAKDFRIDGVSLAKAFLNEQLIDRLERLLFNEASLSFLKTKGSRIEFIVDGLPDRVGPLPPELLDEPALKREPIYKQMIAYNICKACRLCIEVCPKHVYKDDGFGRPGLLDRREEECTGVVQCGQCTDICPENAIHVIMANPVFESTIFVLLPNPYSQMPPLPYPSPLGGDPIKRGHIGGLREGVISADFFVINPLDVEGPLKIPDRLNPKNFAEGHRLLNDAGFYPLLEVRGYPRHFVDSKDPEGDLKIWAKENGRDPGLVLEAVSLLYGKLPLIGSLRRGKYRLDEILHRIIDEMILAESDGGAAEPPTKNL